MKLLDTSTHAQHTTRGLFEAVLANAGAESTRRPDTVSLRLSLGEEGATRFRPIASLPHTSLISPLCDVRTESRLPPAYLPPLRRRCLSRTRAGVASSSTGEIYPSSYPSSYPSRSGLAHSSALTPTVAAAATTQLATACWIASCVVSVGLPVSHYVQPVAPAACTYTAGAVSARACARASVVYFPFSK